MTHVWALKLIEAGCWPELAVWLAYGSDKLTHPDTVISLLCGRKIWSLPPSVGPDKPAISEVAKHLLEWAHGEAERIAEWEQDRA